jgi:hypothetical protein
MDVIWRKHLGIVQAQKAHRIASTIPEVFGGNSDPI